MRTWFSPEKAFVRYPRVGYIIQNDVTPKFTVLDLPGEREGGRIKLLDTYARPYVEPLIVRTSTALHRLGLRPNQVTWAALGVGLVAAAAVVLGHLLAGAALLWLSGYLDAVDGALARASGATSSWGTLLDIVFDRIVELGVILALALRDPQDTFLLLLLTAAIVFSISVFLTVGALSERQGMKSFYYQAGLAERTEGFLLFTLMILLPHWIIWSTALFLAAESFTGLQRMLEARRLLTPHADGGTPSP